MRALFALALLVSGCAASTNHYVAPAKPVFPVRQTMVIWSTSDWQLSPWYRTSDLYSTGPYYLIVSDGDRACVVPAQMWVTVHTGEWHECRTGWRSPRMRSVQAAMPQ